MKLEDPCNRSQQTEDRREKIQALLLVKECYSMKLELLTNATVVDDAIRFVCILITTRRKRLAIIMMTFKDEEENQMCGIITTITDQTFDISEQTRCQ